MIPIIGDVVTQLKAVNGLVLAAKWNHSGTRLLTAGSESGKLSVRFVSYNNIL